MRLRRKIVTLAVSASCALALASCGEQAVSHAQAISTVRTAFAGVFRGPTTKMVITAQGLPGAASLADGNFSVVFTTSRIVGGRNSTICGNRSLQVSVYEATTDLFDWREVGGQTCSDFARVNFSAIATLAGPTVQSEISTALDQVASRPGFAYVHALLLGKWVGFTFQTYSAAEKRMLAAEPSAAKSLAALEQFIKNPQKLRQLRFTLGSSFTQTVETWLSVHQNGTGEYSLNLPVRSFTRSLLAKFTKLLAAELKGSPLTPGEIAQVPAQIPAHLSLGANVWISQGSLTKLQFFIPKTNAYLMIGVSHPALTIPAPSAATMLTEADFIALLHAAIAASPSGARSVSTLSL
ncbi:MAG: hypothetical protein ABR925_09155 [Acidimicrobiales bacterium]|jgi:hypothetical protein